MTHTRATLVGAATALVLLGGCSGTSNSTGQGMHAPAPSSASTNPASTDGSPIAPEVNPAGDIPDDQVFVAWSPPDGSFTVKVPEGWSQSQAESGATVFTDKLNSITIRSSAQRSAPTVASVTQDLAAIRASASGWQDGTVSVVRRTSGPVILATYRADAAADPVTGKVRNDDVELYVFHTSGATVALTLAGPHGADNVDPWRIVTDSFGWVA
jgi:hypothetical protein